ncbi:MAG TPA: hypothetical protein VGM94_14210 [Galbitalea sp.]
MADEEKAEETKDAPATGQPDAWYNQRGLANRLFPGPSNRMSRQTADRIQGLLKPLDKEAWANARSELRQQRQAGTDARHPSKSVEVRGAAPAEPLNFATPEDIAQVREALDAQNELLRAILATTSDTQTDARSTAQNSRTFAWAGTVIALLTLVATVVSIVAVVQAH